MCSNSHPVLRILHLEDCELDKELIDRAMASQGIHGETHWKQTGREFATALAESSFDVVLCDSGGPSFNGMDALALTRQLQPGAAFIFVTGQCKEAIAEDLAMSGADAVVQKDALAELAQVLPRAFERRGRGAGRSIP